MPTLVILTSLVHPLYVRICKNMKEGVPHEQNLSTRRILDPNCYLYFNTYPRVWGVCSSRGLADSGLGDNQVERTQEC